MDVDGHQFVNLEHVAIDLPTAFAGFACRLLQPGRTRLTADRATQAALRLLLRSRPEPLHHLVDTARDGSILRPVAAGIGRQPSLAIQSRKVETRKTSKKPECRRRSVASSFDRDGRHQWGGGTQALVSTEPPTARHWAPIVRHQASARSMPAWR
jgi:hypothetical protein